MNVHLSVAQAFHWCLDHGKAFSEFSRILNKDGAVVLLWNIDDRFASFLPSHSLFLYHCREAAGWVAQFRGHMEIHKNGTPQLTPDLLRQMFSIPEYTFSFQPHEEREWAYRVPTTDQCVIDRILSWSYIAVLPSEEKAKLAEDIKGILERGDDKVWISKEEGTYQHPYKTRVLVSRQK
jgi:hypothetical protein